MDKWFSVVTSAKELLHSTRNFEWVSKDYLGTEDPLGQAMAIWYQHIKTF